MGRLQRLYRQWFPKRMTPWPAGTKRQRAIGGVVCLAIWLAFIIAIMLAGGLDSLNVSAAVAYRLAGFHVLFFLGIFLLVSAAIIKERHPRKNKESEKQ